MPISSPLRSPVEDAVLIAAQSGRALAAAARRAGHVPLVADLFGDTDTLALAGDYQALRGRLGAGVTAAGVLDALDRLAAGALRPALGVILGSGFEGKPHLMAAIDRRFGLLGASAESVRRLKDPIEFAAMLGRLGIPHPAVSLGPVRDPAQWLMKRRGGSGGGHIRPAVSGAPPRNTYLQARAAGKPRSLTFLADGTRALILAATEQWTAPSRRAPWRYGGAIGPIALHPRVRSEADTAIADIVRTVGLRGLASADLLVDDHRWLLLEINPRPGATLDVLDRGPIPLLRQHIEAARGIIKPAQVILDGAWGAQIVYARRAVTTPLINWPPFVMDRPRPGSRIEGGAPICTVEADGTGARNVRALLDSRQAEIIALLAQGNAREPLARTA